MNQIHKAFARSTKLPYLEFPNGSIILVIELDDDIFIKFLYEINLYFIFLMTNKFA